MPGQGQPTMLGGRARVVRGGAGRRSSHTYKRAERNARGPAALHGGDGPLQVSDPRSTNPLSHAFLEACESLGISRNPDLNGASQEGVGFFQVTQRNGQRHSAAAAYLRPARGRPNLTVLTRAHATRVLMEGTRAIGVAYLRDGQVHEARAEREVLLAGETLNSPQLLMRSC